MISQPLHNCKGSKEREIVSQTEATQFGYLLYGNWNKSLVSACGIVGEQTKDYMFLSDVLEMIEKLEKEFYGMSPQMSKIWVELTG